MWLIFCELYDQSALWVHEGLKSRGLKVELISKEMLTSAQKWEHRVGNEQISNMIVLSDGRVIDNKLIKGVINRLQWSPLDNILSLNATEKDYVNSEINAFYLSWMYSLPGVILNRPTPQGLAGQWRHISEWNYIAGKAGLPVPIYKETSYNRTQKDRSKVSSFSSVKTLKRVIVIGDILLGKEIPLYVREGCKQVAKLAEVEMLGVDFTINKNGSWLFENATTCPDLKEGGDTLLDALVNILLDERERVL